MNLDNLNQEWADFQNNSFFVEKKEIIDDDIAANVPKCSEIYISTKTKIAYYDTDFDLNSIFWNLPVIEYHNPIVGIVKKSIKMNCISKEEAEILNNNIKKCNEETPHSVETDIILQRDLNNEQNRFKDVRKITIGLCKKDLINFKRTKKSAFYNCFALIIRIKENNAFREVHVKLFNTGKLEIPGIQKDDTLYIVLNNLANILKPLCNKEITYYKNKIQTVLINSNFNCGYYINRNKLYNILKYKYNINANYDPCSYPGIQCKFYYNIENKLNDGKCKCEIKCDKKKPNKKCLDISFMIFRTGSVLVVGMCEEPVIHIVYNFLTELFKTEYSEIKIENVDQKPKKTKKKKVRKKVIIFTE